MSDEPTMKKAARRTMQATPELRWSVGLLGSFMGDFKKLEQAWRCLEDGAVEWREVPTVMGDTL